MLDGDDLEFGEGQDVGPLLPPPDVELISPVWPPEMEGSEQTVWPEPYQDAGGEWVFPQPYFDPSIIVDVELPPEDGSSECNDGPSLEQGGFDGESTARPAAPEGAGDIEELVIGGNGDPSLQPQVYNANGPDVSLTSFTATSSNWTFNYSIGIAPLTGLHISVYRSTDGTVANGTLLQDFEINAAAELNVQSHTKSFSVAAFVDVPSDYYLVAKVDPGDLIDESNENNNEAQFAGGVFKAGDIVHVHGASGSANETVTLSQSSNLTVTFGTSFNYTPASIAGVRVRLHDGNDTVNSSSSVTKDTWVYGGAGNDSLYAGGGSDKLYGGAGNDTYYFGSGNLQHDSVTEDSMTGTDVLNFASFGSSVSLDLMQTTEQQVSSNLYLTVYCTVSDGYSEAIANVTGSSYNDTITGNLRANSIYGGNGNDILHGGGGNDFLDDGAGDDTAYGDAGNDSFAQNTTGSDTYFGGSDADYFYGGYSAETFYGGSGNDVYTFPYFSTGLNTIYEDQFADRDQLNFASFGSGTQGITINLASTAPQPMGNMTLQLMDATGIEDVIGTNFADTITGNARNNLLQGGMGADTYRFVPVTVGDQGSDEISETSSSGGVYDTLNFASFSDAVDVDLSSSVSRQINSVGLNNLWLKLTNASSVRSVVGSNYADTIVGNSGDNFLYGGGGNDTLRGGSGNDLLDGGADNDYCYGEAGNDTFESPGPNGADNDHLYGGTGNDTFYVGRGDDELRGEENDDTYVFTSGADGSKSIIELAGIGADKLDFSALTSGVSIDLSSTSSQFNAMSGISLTLSTTTGTTDGIENVMTGGGSDVMTGNSRSNVLQGGLGDDTYKFAGSGSLGTDTVVETNNWGGGNDTLDFSTLSANLTANLTLTSQQTVAAGVLNLTLGSSAAWIENLTGGSGNDTLTGNTLANILSGGVGNDTLTGNAGDDVLIGDSEFSAGGDDTLSGGDGNDTYRFYFTDTVSSDSLTDSAGLDLLDYSSVPVDVTVDLTQSSQQPVSYFLNLTLGTSAASIEHVVGGWGDDALTGNSLDNILTGGDGDDTLVGGPGNDTLIGGYDTDTYSFSGNQNLGSDAIQETNDGQKNLFEASTLSGVGHLSYTTGGPQVVSQNILTVTLSGSGVWQNNAPMVSEDPFASIGEDSVSASAVNLASVFHDLETSEAQITYQILGNSDPSVVPTASLNVVSGSLVATPAENKYGYTYVTVRATDSQSVSVDADILLVVTPVDDVPQFVGVSNQISVTRNSTNIDIPYILDLWSYFTDVEYASYLDYSFVGSSTPREVSHASIEDGILRLDFSRMPGTSSIVIRASDDSNHAATDLTINLNIDVPLPVSVFDAWGPLEGYVDGFFQLHRSSDTTQPLTVSYSLSTGASGSATFAAGEVLSSVIAISQGQPDGNDIGETISIALDNAASNNMTQSNDMDKDGMGFSVHVSPAFEGGQDGAIRMYRWGDLPAEPVTWSLHFSTVTNGADITSIYFPGLTYGGHSFAVGEYSFTYPIHAIDDADFEGLEGGGGISFNYNDAGGPLHPFGVYDNDVAPPDSVSVNLTIDGLTEAQEESPGAYLAVNDDSDEVGSGPDTVDIGSHHDIAIERLYIDNEPDRGRQHRTGDADTRAGSLTVGLASATDQPVRGSLQWTIPEGLAVYWLRAGRYIPVSDDDDYTAGANESLYFEGLDEGAGDLLATFTPIRGAAGSDKVKVTAGQATITFPDGRYVAFYDGAAAILNDPISLHAEVSASFSPTSYAWSVSGSANGTFDDQTHTPLFTPTAAGTAKVNVDVTANGTILHGNADVHVIQVGSFNGELPDAPVTVIKSEEEVSHFIISRTDDYGDLLSVRVRTFVDSIEPYQWGTDFSVAVNQTTGDATLTVTRSGKYDVVETRTKGMKNSIRMVRTHEPDVRKFGTTIKTEAYRIQMPQADLALIAAENEFDLNRYRENTSHYPHVVEIKSLADAEKAIKDFAENRPDPNIRFSVLILDHGRPGQQNVGGGPESKPDGVLSDKTSPGLTKARKHFLDSIRGFVSVLLFEGCSVANELAETEDRDEGMEFLQMIATGGQLRAQGRTQDCYHTTDGTYVPDTSIYRYADPAPNAQPRFTGGANQTVSQPSPAQIVHDWATNIDTGAPDEWWQYLTFEVFVDNPSLFQETPILDNLGNLSFNPAVDAHGTAHVTVVLRDNGGSANNGIDTSTAYNFTITVN